MRSRLIVGTLVVCFALGGAAVILWQLRSHREHERKLAEEAQACRLRAEQGDPAAQAILAYLYSHGQGVQRNYDEAVRWYRKAADQGNPRGENGLGYMYYTGEGVDQDLTEAASWYRKAADKGYATAEENLGDLYYYGFGLPVNYAEAARWYRKAAEQGNAHAQYDLGCVYLYGKGIPQDRVVANWWFHKAAANGNEAAQRFLGLRGSGLSVMWQVFVAIEAFACFFLFGAYLRPLHPEVKTRDSHALVGAILQLILVALVLIASFHGIPRDPPYILIAFHSIFAIVLGMSVTTVICLLWRRGALWMLIISCIWFVASNLIIIWICLGHSVTLRTLSVIPGLYGIEATPIGMAISAAILLWITDKPGDRIDSPGGESAGPDHFEGPGIGE